jgi:polyhydroxybutyrate depolymerase
MPDAFRRHLVLAAALAVLICGLYGAALVAASRSGGLVALAAHVGAYAGSRRAPSPTAAPVPGAPAWPNDGAVDAPVASSGCGQPPPAPRGATTKQSFAVNPATNEGFMTRDYWIHIPARYDASQLTALVLVFHGGGGTGIGMEATTGLSALADQQRFLVVYPQGLPFNGLGSGYTTWAATGPLDSVGNGVDDLLFVSNLLDALQRQYCVDPQRIFATGFSAGGGMTAFLTCGLTGRIAAFAPLSGDAYQFEGGCPARHPTAILEFHGAADPYELYVGIPAREDPDWRRMGVREWLTTWAARDGCTAGPAAFLREPSALGEQWTGCRDGTTVAHYLIADLGHSWPPPIDGQSAAAVLWRFFQVHPLPAVR